MGNSCRLRTVRAAFADAGGHVGASSGGRGVGDSPTFVRGMIDPISRLAKELRMKLHVVVEKDETGYYVAEVPALPGCLSQGKTREDALTNIKEAIEGWLEVMEGKQTFDPTRTVEVVV
jgi:predicted RNase H-like HicB family nuclease